MIFIKKLKLLFKYSSITHLSSKDKCLYFLTFIIKILSLQWAVDNGQRTVKARGRLDALPPHLWGGAKPGGAK